MKHCLYIHQDYQPPKLSLYLLEEISCEWAHFPQVLYAKCYCNHVECILRAHFT